MAGKFQQEAPYPVAPLPGSETFSPAPSLRWEPVDGATDYWVQVAKDEAFVGEVISDRSPILRYVVPRALVPGTYYWRVAGVKKEGVGDFSAVSRFVVLPYQRIFTVPPDADLAEMRKIVAEAAAQTPARVVFAPGAVYRVRPDEVAFAFKGVSNFEMDGNGATFILTNPAAGFLSMDHCKRMAVRNFTIDFDPLPFSVGTVRTVDQQSGTFWLISDPGMPSFDAPHMLEHWGMGVMLDRFTPGRIKRSSFLIVETDKSRSCRSGETFAIAMKNPNMLRLLEPGDKFVQFAREGGHEMITASFSQELTFFNNTSYASPAGHYVLLYCDDAKVLGCRELIRPGRWFGGNADGVHVRSSETGPWIEGCTIEGIGDDGIAIYSKGINILEKPSETSLRLDNDYFTLHVGSEFLIFDPRSGEPVAENLTVKSVTEVPKSGRFLAHRLVEFSPGFSEPISVDFKEAWKNGQVFDSTAQHRQFMVRRNTIRQVRRFGVVVRASDGAVEENEITHTSCSAIIFQNEPLFWKNGLQSRNVLIQNNTIRDCNFTQSSKNAGSISILLRRIHSDGGKTWESMPSPWRGHQDIAIRNNLILQWQQRGISVQSAKNVLVTGNRIEETLPNTLDTEAQYGIYLENVEDARVENNTVAPSPLMTEAIKVLDCGNVGVKDNNLSASHGGQ